MCEISERLDRVHKWAHRCADVMTEGELFVADRLAAKLLDLLNDQAGEQNGIKLVALLQVLECGVNHMEQYFGDPPPQGTLTIN